MYSIWCSATLRRPPVCGLARPATPRTIATKRPMNANKSKTRRILPMPRKRLLDDSGHNRRGASCKTMGFCVQNAFPAFSPQYSAPRHSKSPRFLEQTAPQPDENCSKAPYARRDMLGLLLESVRRAERATTELANLLDERRYRRKSLVGVLRHRPHGDVCQRLRNEPVRRPLPRQLRRLVHDHLERILH